MSLKTKSKKMNPGIYIILSAYTKIIAKNINLRVYPLSQEDLDGQGVLGDPVNKKKT